MPAHNHIHTSETWNQVILLTILWWIRHQLVYISTTSSRNEIFGMNNILEQRCKVRIGYQLVTHYLYYKQHIRQRRSFNLDLNKDNVVWLLISSGKLFHNDTPLCRITFDVTWRLQKCTCSLSVWRVAMLCTDFVLKNILFSAPGSTPVLHLYIITNTHGIKAQEIQHSK